MLAPGVAVYKMSKKSFVCHVKAILINSCKRSGERRKDTQRLGILDLLPRINLLEFWIVYQAPCFFNVLCQILFNVSYLSMSEIFLWKYQNLKRIMGLGQSVNAKTSNRRMNFFFEWSNNPCDTECHTG